jgi:hypothetical protein
MFIFIFIFYSKLIAPLSGPRCPLAEPRDRPPPIEIRHREFIYRTHPFPSPGARDGRQGTPDIGRRGERT